MYSDNFRPKLRAPLDIKFEKTESTGDVLVFRDSLGLMAVPLVLRPEVAPLIASFNGDETIAEIAARYQQFGITNNLVIELASLLDENFLLDTERFRLQERGFRQIYRDKKIREAVLKGGAYPSDPIELKKQITEYINYSTIKLKENLVALATPHIDYRRGHRCYGESFGAVIDTKPTLIILTGTGHQFSNRLFHLTDKSFDSPLGLMNCATERVQRIGKQHGDRSYFDEILHRNEHSLELQLPFLKLLYPNAKIIPFLVGSFHKFIMQGQEPKSNEEYQSFVGALAEEIKRAKNEGEKILFLCGVDMAHIGRYFGDTQDLTKDWLEQIEIRDQQYLSIIMNRDERALFSHIAEDQDVRRICGFPTMYTVIDLLNRLNIKTEAKLINYSQAVDYTSQCCVTFAGVGWEEI